MLIAVDIDQVLADMVTGIAKFHNERYGTSLTKESFHSFHFWKVWGGTEEEMVEKMHQFYGTSYFKDLLPLPGAVEGIEALSRSYELTIATARPHYLEADTRAWLERHFQGRFSGIHFTNAHANDGTPASSKLEICARLGAACLIDDYLPEGEATRIPEGLRFLLLDALWNRKTALPARAERARSWKDVVALLAKEPASH